MPENKKEFVHRRKPYHMDILRQRHPEAPDNALDFWAEDAAEKEYRTGRVYADPVQVEMGTIGVYDPKAEFTAGHAQGMKLRFGPAGPMVSVISLSYQEGLELALGLMRALESKGEWPNDIDPYA